MSAPSSQQIQEKTEPPRGVKHVRPPIKPKPVLPPRPKEISGSGAENKIPLLSPTCGPCSPTLDIPSAIKISQLTGPQPYGTRRTSLRRWSSSVGEEANQENNALSPVENRSSDLPAKMAAQPLSAPLRPLQTGPAWKGKSPFMLTTRGWGEQRLSQSRDHNDSEVASQKPTSSSVSKDTDAQKGEKKATDVKSNRAIAQEEKSEAQDSDRSPTRLPSGALEGVKMVSSRLGSSDGSVELKDSHKPTPALLQSDLYFEGSDRVFQDNHQEAALVPPIASKPSVPVRESIRVPKSQAEGEKVRNVYGDVRVAPGHVSLSGDTVIDHLGTRDQSHQPELQAGPRQSSDTQHSNATHEQHHDQHQPMEKNVPSKPVPPKPKERKKPAVRFTVPKADEPTGGQRPRDCTEPEERENKEQTEYMRRWHKGEPTAEESVPHAQQMTDEESKQVTARPEPSAHVRTQTPNNALTMDDERFSKEDIINQVPTDFTTSHSLDIGRPDGHEISLHHREVTFTDEKEDAEVPSIPHTTKLYGSDEGGDLDTKEPKDVDEDHSGFHKTEPEDPPAKNVDYMPHFTPTPPTSSPAPRAEHRTEASSSLGSGTTYIHHYTSTEDQAEVLENKDNKEPADMNMEDNVPSKEIYTHSREFHPPSTQEQMKDNQPKSSKLDDFQDLKSSNSNKFPLISFEDPSDRVIQSSDRSDPKDVIQYYNINSQNVQDGEKVKYGGVVSEEHHYSPSHLEEPLHEHPKSEEHAPSEKTNDTPLPSKLIVHAYTSSEKRGHAYTSSEEPDHAYASLEEAGHAYASSEEPGHAYASSEEPSHAYASSEEPSHAYASSEEPSHAYASSEEPGHAYTSSEPGHAYASSSEPGHAYVSSEEPGHAYASLKEPGHAYTSSEPGHAYASSSEPGHAYASSEEPGHAYASLKEPGHAYTSSELGNAHRQSEEPSHTYASSSEPDHAYASAELAHAHRQSEKSSHAYASSGEQDHAYASLEETGHAYTSSEPAHAHRSSKGLVHTYAPSEEPVQDYSQSEEDSHNYAVLKKAQHAYDKPEHLTYAYTYPEEPGYQYECHQPEKLDEQSEEPIQQMHSEEREHPRYPVLNNVGHAYDKPEKLAYTYRYPEEPGHPHMQPEEQDHQYECDEPEEDSHSYAVLKKAGYAYDQPENLAYTYRYPEEPGHPHMQPEKPGHQYERYQPEKLDETYEQPEKSMSHSVPSEELPPIQEPSRTPSFTFIQSEKPLYTYDQLKESYAKEEQRPKEPEKVHEHAEKTKHIRPEEPSEKIIPQETSHYQQTQATEPGARDYLSQTIMASKIPSGDPEYQQAESKEPTLYQTDSEESHYHQKHFIESQYQDSEGPNYQQEDSEKPNWQQEHSEGPNYQQQDSEKPNWQQEHSEGPNYQQQDSEKPNYHYKHSQESHHQRAQSERNDLRSSQAETLKYNETSSEDSRAISHYPEHSQQESLHTPGRQTTTFEESNYRLSEPTQYMDLNASEIDHGYVNLTKTDNKSEKYFEQQQRHISPEETSKKDDSTPETSHKNLPSKEQVLQYTWQEEPKTIEAHTFEREHKDVLPRREHRDVLQEQQDHRDVLPGQQDNRDILPEQVDHRDVLPEQRDYRDVLPEQQDHKDVLPEQREHRYVLPELQDYRDVLPEQRDYRDVLQEQREHRDVLPEQRDHRDDLPEQRDHRDVLPEQGEHRITDGHQQSGESQQNTQINGLSELEESEYSEDRTNGPELSEEINEESPKESESDTEETPEDNFDFLEGTTVLDTSLMRCRASIGKKRVHRTPATGASQEEADPEYWMFRDSTEPKSSRANESDNEESGEASPERPPETSPSSAKSPTKKGGLFSGIISPSLLKGRLKARSKTSEDEAAKAESKESQDPTSPGKDKSESSSHSLNWLQALKKKKKKHPK